MVESEEELKSLLMKMKEESGKAGLKLNIQKMKILASGPIILWQIGGETMETVREFILGGSKITADGDCSHEIKRHLLLGRNVVANLDNILKSRDITLPTKVHLVKAMVFTVVMYGSEKAMAPHSSTFAWKIPWTEEPDRLQFMGSLELDTTPLSSDFTFTFHFHALEKEMATHSSVLAWRIPGTGSLVGCRLWGLTESNTTEATQQQQQQHVWI